MATQPNPEYTLTGLITDRQGEPLEGLIVRRSRSGHHNACRPSGREAITNAEGRYTIRSTEKDFKGGVDVFIRVYDGEELLGESPVKRNSENQITIDLQMDYIKADPNEPAQRVHGVVRDAQDDLLPQVSVCAFDRDLRSEQALGQSQTYNQGFYLGLGLGGAVAGGIWGSHRGGQAAEALYDYAH